VRGEKQEGHGKSCTGWNRKNRVQYGVGRKNWDGSEASNLAIWGNVNSLNRDSERKN
jgi:hypothetical protein